MEKIPILLLKYKKKNHKVKNKLQMKNLRKILEETKNKKKRKNLATFLMLIKARMQKQREQDKEQ